MAQTKSPFDFSLPPLDPQDQRLIEAYSQIGRTLDDLPYTEQFEEIRRRLGLEDSDPVKHDLFRRLLRLRKRGRLPRVDWLVD